MKQHIPYVLCDKEPEPKRTDREKLFHSMCAHQVNCPRENCHKLTASWHNCAKLVEPEPAEVPAEETYEDVFPDAGEDPELVQPKRGRKKKADEK
jgi:hypothetical protein